ncbi:hypothetical protein BCEP4_710018 [Burkholderia cepacia]|nr:hypothetical protein BCEP4_710018 [Burkholderia cepacia]
MSSRRSPVARRYKRCDMRCMHFPRWDVMGRSPNLRYGKAHVTGSTTPRVVRRDTLAIVSIRT